MSNLFSALGFSWNREKIPTQISVHSKERVCAHFQRIMPEYVWDASMLEGNPITFVEVKTLMDGITIGGRKLTDQEQVLNLVESSRHLLQIIKREEFQLSKKIFTDLHGLVAKNEALEWGMFRGEGNEKHYTPEVLLGEQGRYKPPVTDAELLNKKFDTAVTVLEQEVKNPLERGIVFFLFGALMQFFFDGNKRTSRMMMNGVLMSSGIDAISIPASRAQEFNQKMIDFYLHKQADDMIEFMLSCANRE